MNVLIDIDIKFQVSNKQVSCEPNSSDQNDVVDDSSIDVNVKSKMVGKTPIRPGQVKFEVTVPEGQLFEDPCERGSNRVIGKTFQIQDPQCKIENNELSVTVRSDQKIDLSTALQDYLQLRIKLKKKDSPNCSKNETTISATITVDHDLYTTVTLF